jgi:hypothetical protein
VFRECIARAGCAWGEAQLRMLASKGVAETKKRMQRVHPFIASLPVLALVTIVVITVVVMIAVMMVITMVVVIARVVSPSDGRS